ncbi:hypothetical protein [Maritalea porphyrae]|jgi:glutathione synthase/RimK-type ligase-like ATP-grasp enzyme|uniref:hypothetical protein n=1 Tax=Maritalea porphyrae TaxID=880732 RepID=UPI0022AE7195|nr:hypothetical protein [Maritalea porphyrae]MCZ4273064.1 hypothetical protein [Maritalea porphyrae]
MQIQNIAEKLNFNRAQWLNQNCPCTSLERKLLPKLEAAGLLFSETPMFLSQAEFKQIEQQVAALEAVIKLPDYQKATLAHTPSVTSHGKGPSGMFMGYDFHMSDDGPRLIEINTNAGGAFLVDALYRAQDVCCWNGKPKGNKDFSNTIAEMFRNEWRSAGHQHQLKTIAIVDENPTEQFLYDEFLIAKELLEKQGFEVLIADPNDFTFREGALWIGETKIDLVYNRSVDFYFDKPSHAALREALINEAAVITPNPRHHALFAAKQNLTILSDPKRLAEMGATSDQISALSPIPKTTLVNAENADEIWSKRKNLFFKPLAGHGGKAVYRGDKVTKKTWAHILENAYVAQEIAIPCVRQAKSDCEAGVAPLKSDIRLYTYQGKMILAAARLYQGQTTNFRTVGGGFAPIYVV